MRSMAKTLSDLNLDDIHTSCGMRMPIPFSLDAHFNPNQPFILECLVYSPSGLRIRIQ